jgi:formate hydrogenlyase subunit 3/multisubunit Na+/H+ antiporter MnhD subunit
MGDLLSTVIIMSVSTLLACAVTYSWGYKEGSREGYTRGRSVSRHISAANKAAK